jgi:hypothetical protein
MTRRVEHAQPHLLEPTKSSARDDADASGHRVEHLLGVLAWFTTLSSTSTSLAPPVILAG